MPRRRTLAPDEAALWQSVAASARPMHASFPAHPAPRPPPAEPPAPSADPPADPRLPAFRIGAAARPALARHDLAPTIADQLSRAPVQMDRKAFNAMTRGRTEPEARLDLHGMTLAEAHPRLLAFVRDAHAAGRRLVLVITGKGKLRDDGAPMPVRIGVLRHAVPQWLHQAPLGPLVLQVAPAHRRHGGDGALYVYLRRAR